jgi:hypothetical protein
MTDKKSFADRARGQATDDDSTHTHQAPKHRRWTDVIKHLWPALVVPPIPIPRPNSAPESCAKRRRR